MHQSKALIELIRDMLFLKMFKVILRSKNPKTSIKIGRFEIRFDPNFKTFFIVILFILSCKNVILLIIIIFKTFFLEKNIETILIDVFL
jgi:hypothetical protein